MATCYLAEVFEPYFGDGSSLGLQPGVRGRGGAARHRRRHPQRRAGACPRRPGRPRCSIFNGDILTGLDIAGPGRRRTPAAGADVSLHLARVEDPARLRPGADRRRRGGCTAFTGEAADAGGARHRPDQRRLRTSSGAAVIDSIPAGRPVSVEREYLPRPARSRGPSCTASPVDLPYRLDLGTPAGVRTQASADLVRGVVPSPAVPGRRGEPGPGSRGGGRCQALRGHRGGRRSPDRCRSGRPGSTSSTTPSSAPTR
ncbi:GDP-mannose pyrophosphorylase [Streptomyces avidinii]